MIVVNFYRPIKERPLREGRQGLRQCNLASQAGELVHWPDQRLSWEAARRRLNEQLHPLMVVGVVHTTF